MFYGTVRGVRRGALLKYRLSALLTDKADKQQEPGVLMERYSDEDYGIIDMDTKEAFPPLKTQILAENANKHFKIMH